MIIFGTNAFAVKSYTFSDLQIADESGRHSVELRQRFFHVFFIPFFPIGQSWVLRRAGDSNKYMVSPELESHIEQLGLKQSPPWYSFIGLILVGIGLLYMAVVR